MEISENMRICELCDQIYYECATCKKDSGHIDMHTNITFDDGEFKVHLVCLVKSIKKLIREEWLKNQPSTKR